MHKATNILQSLSTKEHANTKHNGHVGKGCSCYYRRRIWEVLCYTGDMNTITLLKSTYSEILKRQTRVESAIAKLQETVEEIVYDEIKPSVLKRIEKHSRLLDEGKGIRLKNMKEYHGYVRSL